MDDPGVAMDIWDYVGCSLEDLAKSCDVGFHTPEVVRAAPRDTGALRKPRHGEQFVEGR